MIPEYEVRIAARISKEMQKQICQLCQERKFKSKSQIIRAALQEFLKEDKETNAAK